MNGRVGQHRQVLSEQFDWGVARGSRRLCDAGEPILLIRV
jgi:hypothetical protein